MTTTHPPIELHGKAGAQVPIELKSTPGAGAVWVTPDVPAGCWIEEGTKAASETGVGGATTQRFQFGARKPGRYTVQFELKRRWESVAREVQSVEIEIS